MLIARPRILVVDDDAPVLTVTAEVLKRGDYEVVTALTVKEAVGCIAREKFNLVITDYTMGDGTGEDVVLAVLRIQPTTPICIASGNCSRLPAWLCDGRAVARVFSKPYSVPAFMAAVKEVLAGPRGPDRAPLPFAPLEAVVALPKGVEEMVHRVVDQESIIAVTDKKGTIVYANDRFCEISGYNRTELLGQNHRLLKSGQHPPAFYKSLWGTVLSGRTWRGEICNKAKDGRLYYVDTAIAPLRTEGLISHFIAIRTDITARKEAELELAEQGKREEGDRRMAALGRMADGVLHDLSNILTGMMGISSVGGEETNKEILHEAIDHMARLTRTLRDFSTGRPTRPERFRLNPLLSCACSLVRHRKEAPRSLIIVEQITSTEAVELIGNEGQIFEVVLNLVVNAIEAASVSDQPRIHVHTEMEADKVTIRVEDNGPGVPESVAHSIFEPFTSTKGQGRGVGLSSAKNIAVAHGGELLLENAGGNGRGACFQIILPAQVTAVPPPAEQETTPTPGRKRVVLVSEDEPDVCRQIAHDAIEVGLTAINAGDLADLLALASKMKEVLAAAILDSCEIDSEQGAVACLRRLSPDLPIILISGSLPTRGKRATAWGDVESFPKPFEADALIDLLSATIATSEAESVD